MGKSLERSEEKAVIGVVGMLWRSVRGHDRVSDRSRVVLFCVRSDGWQYLARYDKPIVSVLELAAMTPPWVLHKMATVNGANLSLSRAVGILGFSCSFPCTIQSKLSNHNGALWSTTKQQTHTYAILYCAVD